MVVVFKQLIIVEFVYKRKTLQYKIQMLHDRRNARVVSFRNAYSYFRENYLCRCINN